MCSNNAGWCPCSSENRKWVCSKTTGYWDDWKCWQVLLHMLTQMKGWSQIRSGRRKESTRQWSTRKKILSRDRGNFLSFSSSLPCNSIFLLWKREKRGDMFLSPARLSFPSCLVHPPQKLAMIHSLQTQVSAAQLPDLLSSRYTLLSFLHQLCTRLTKAHRKPLSSCSFLKGWSWDSSTL